MSNSGALFKLDDRPIGWTKKASRTKLWQHGRLPLNSSKGWARSCGAMNMANSCIEGMASNWRRSGSEGFGFKTWCRQELFTAESPLKCTLALVICTHNSCMRWIGWKYIRFTCERSKMSTILRDWPGWWQPQKMFCFLTSTTFRPS